MANGNFFGNDGLTRLFFLNTNMAPKAKYLFADALLKAFCQCNGDDHDRYADDSGSKRNANDQPGKTVGRTGLNAVGYKGSWMHMVGKQLKNKRLRLELLPLF